MDWLDGFNEARELSETLQLSFWVYSGNMFLQDGGKRGYACTDEDDTYDDFHWDVFGNASSRNASPEEIALWDLISRKLGNQEAK